MNFLLAVDPVFVLAGLELQFASFDGGHPFLFCLLVCIGL